MSKLKKLEQDYHKEVEKCFEFLKENLSDVMQPSVVKLMQTHGHSKEMKLFAKFMENNEQEVKLMINNSEFKKAIQRISELKSTKERKSLMTRYAPLFFKYEPILVIQTLKNEKFKRIMNYDPIVPSLMQIDHQYLGEV